MPEGIIGPPLTEKLVRILLADDRSKGLEFMGPVRANHAMLKTLRHYGLLQADQSSSAYELRAGGEIVDENADLLRGEFEVALADPA